MGTLPAPLAQATSAILALPAIMRLSARAQKFVKAYVADPTSLRKACLSAGYTYQAYRKLLADPLVVAALEEEVERRKAEAMTKADVISKAMELVEKQGTKEEPASDMAKARLLELVADLSGMRQIKPEPQAIHQTLSATFAPAAPSLPQASATLAALTAGLPEEE